MNFFKQFTNNRLIASHRGYRALYPENTMLAFKKSLKKCDFLEFDIQFSRDDIAIVFHDNKLLRTSNAKELKEFKTPYNTWDYTYKELKKLDISSWFYDFDPFFQNNRLKKTKVIQRIPKLEDVLKFAKKNNLPLNIEIKYKNNHTLKNRHLQSIVDLVSKYNYEKKVIISSFWHDYVKSIKILNPKLSTAALAHNNHPENLICYLKDLKVDAYHVNERLATKKLIKLLNSENIVVNVYTVNNRQKQEKLFKFGVKSIFTDFL